MVLCNVSGHSRTRSPFEELKNQIYMGDDSFVEQIRYKIDVRKDLTETPSSQRRKVPESLEFYAQNDPTRDEAIIDAVGIA